MKLAIMQPYFFPYLGYFQLIHAVDKFVFYDDVAYIKGGWINRNRIPLEGKPHYLTVPTLGASPHRLIHDVGVAQNGSPWRRKMLDTLRMAYRNAPFKDAGMALVESVVSADWQDIGALARESVLHTLRYLGIQRDVVATSRTYGNGALKAQARVLDICKNEGAALYVNAPGGSSLYNADSFLAQGCRLKFLAPTFPPYDQGTDDFITQLSIIDIVMRCPPTQITEMLSAYNLTDPAEDHGLRGDC